MTREELAAQAAIEEAIHRRREDERASEKLAAQLSLEEMQHADPPLTRGDRERVGVRGG